MIRFTPHSTYSFLTSAQSSFSMLISDDKRALIPDAQRNCVITVTSTSSQIQTRILQLGGYRLVSDYQLTWRRFGAIIVQLPCRVRSLFFKKFAVVNFHDLPLWLSLSAGNEPTNEALSRLRAPSSPDLPNVQFNSKINSKRIYDVQINHTDPKVVSFAFIHHDPDLG